MPMRVQQYHICEKDDIWNPVRCSCQNRKYLASILDNSVITSDEIIDVETKSYNQETKRISKDIICEAKRFYLLLAFLLITGALLKKLTLKKLISKIARVIISMT